VLRRLGNLQPVDCTFNDIATFVSHLIETWWRSASTPFTQSVFLRITALGADATHATVLDLLSIMACTVGTVYAQAGRTLAWTSWAGTRHADGVEYRPDLRRVAALPGSDYDRQRQAMPVDTQVNLAGDAAA